MLGDNRTVFDNVNGIAAEDATEQQTVHDVVVFIRFADEGEDIYEKRGGLDYLKNQFIGSSNSLAAYLDEFSWGQVKTETHFYPTDSSGDILCYVDDQPVNYYKKKSDANPIGYTSSQKSTRRSELLNKVKAFMGNDFEEKLGIESALYNLTFIVPDEENWNDLLWSHKSSTYVNGKYQVYNFITYPAKEDVSRTLCHEFMHSLGFPDLYRYYNSGTPGTPIEKWSIMAYTSYNAGHPTVYEKQKYGKWIQNENAITEISTNGHYSLGAATASQDNTLAYKVSVPGSTNEYFMIEYRGGDKTSFDGNLGAEGLIFYRVNTNCNGNSYGPPDEIYVLRNENSSVYNAYFDGTTGRTEFSNFQLYDSTEDLGIRVYNIKKENGKMTFDIDLGREDKIATVYYENSNFQDAYIHYQIGSGNWTTAPGIQMTETTEQAGYSYKAVINLGKSSALQACFNNGAGNWDSNNGANYSLGAGTYGVKNGTVTKLEELPLAIKEISTSVPSGKLTATLPVTFIAETEGGKGNLQYQFLLNGEVVQDYSSQSSYTWENTYHSYSGHTLTVNVKDSTGEIITETIDYKVNQEISVTGIGFTPSGQATVGDTVSIIASGMFGTGTLKRQIEVQKQGGTKQIVQEFTTSNPVSWKPTQAGSYTVFVTFKDEAGYTVTKEMSYTVVGKTGNTATIYYKNDSFTNKYIHYQVGNGSWTVAPGELMEASSSQSGYTHKYVIDLGDSDEVHVCFNNGNGSWDNNGGKNYTVSAGVYGCSNGNIVTLEDGLRVSDFTASVSTAGTFENFRISASAAGGTAPYQYRFGYVFGGKEISMSVFGTSNNIGCVFNQAGVYTLYVDVKDAEGTVVRKTIDNFVVEGPKVSVLKTSVASPQKVGTSITITGDVTNLIKDTYDFCSYTVTQNGVTTVLTTNADKTATWTPTEAGTYTITYRYSTYLGNTLEKSIEYVIQDVALNQTTIYYSGYTTPYIHYKIGDGSWTAVPGVPMTATTEQTGYTHKMTIDMGDASSLTACFNDGNGNWDSRNGSNYSFGVGIYTYNNGVITRIQ